MMKSNSEMQARIDALECALSEAITGLEYARNSGDFTPRELDRIDRLTRLLIGEQLSDGRELSYHERDRIADRFLRVAEERSRSIACSHGPDDWCEDLKTASRLLRCRS